ncbi:hypothetical protein [Arcobacter porcinus]|uniref:Uncharacterized protein n=1 Tax=Arcobacter porcinus TaxID=1935204 RepID=A0A5C2HHY7_9BACT|nr:hypothetical protein [Arcobacter porcinus]OCL96862.1 hypothetical protein AAX27_00496 [Aliarcobacter thereius]QEP40692.1 hypothetical protein APORC_1092 [Arcobacter porcinus]
MIGILKNIFKNKKDNDITDNPFVIKASSEILELQRKCKLRAFNEEFSKQDYLKIEKIEFFKSFVLGEIFINSIEGNTVLSVQEKKDLGLSTRHKATKEILDFLNLNNIPSEKLKTTSLKKIILNFYNRVYSKSNYYFNFEEYKKINITKVKYIVGVLETSCKWCVENDNKIFNVEDFIEIMDNNCKCEHNGNVVMAEIK